MSSSRPKSLSEIVNGPKSGIGALAASAQARVDLAERLRGALPDLLAGHLLSANVNAENCLVVLCDEPEWAARMRYESTTLLSRCRELHAGAVRVRFRVASDPAAHRDRD